MIYTGHDFYLSEGQNAMTDIESLSGKTPSAEGSPAKKAWVKPSAVSAKVQNVTETGNSVPPVSDFVTCAS